MAGDGGDLGMGAEQQLLGGVCETEMGARAEAVRGGLSTAKIWSCKKCILLGKLWVSQNNRIFFFSVLYV